MTWKFLKENRQLVEQHTPSLALHWSEHPGGHERHLQRRWNNPLFPMERRQISAEDVDSARAKDEAAIRPLIEKVVSLQRDWPAELPVNFLPWCYDTRRTEEQQRKFEKHWDPVQILKDVERLNPDFYPRPVTELPSPQKGVKSNIIDRQTGYLTKDQLVEVHGRCGNVLHARNPYKTPLDYSAYEALIPEWMDKIMALLNSHQIRLLDEDTFHLVHMKEERDDHVHMYTFRKATKQPVG